MGRVMKQTWIVLAVTLAGSGPGAWADAPEGPSDRELVSEISQTDAVDVALAKAVRWLVARQDHNTGSFGAKMAHAYTALSCLALMSAGEQPGRSQYGESLQKGLLYIAQRVHDNSGYLGGDGGRMYSHALGTLALCQGYGMLDAPDKNKIIGESIAQALSVILKAQVMNRQSPHFGGWRYEPRPGEADLSVTSWQIFALSAAKGCGFEVPNASLEAAVDFVRRCHNGTGFAYQPSQQPTYAMRAAGIASMKLLGADVTEADAAKISTAARDLDRVDPGHGAHFYCQSYYLALATNMLAGEEGNSFLPKLERALVRLQAQDGSFAKHSGYDGGVYATSFAITCLAVRYQYLPLLQQ